MISVGGHYTGDNSDGYHDPAQGGNGDLRSFGSGSGGGGSGDFYPQDTEISRKISELENKVFEIKGTIKGLATQAEVEKRPTRGEFWGGIGLITLVIIALGFFIRMGTVT